MSIIMILLMWGTSFNKIQSLGCSILPVPSLQEEGQMANNQASLLTRSEKKDNRMKKT